MSRFRLKPFVFHDVEQNTDPWFDLRGGRLTSSKLGVIMANYGKAFGEPAKKYAVTIAVEQITGQAISSTYTNAHMERGHIQEPLARMAYEESTFCEVTNGGFFDLGFVGCSPDGLVDDDGVIEIKSVIDNVHYANVFRANVDPAYKWQCIGNLKFTKRSWLDFISYCDTYPTGRKIFTYRLHAECYKKEFNMISSRIREFYDLVEETKRNIQIKNYQLMEKARA